MQTVFLHSVKQLKILMSQRVATVVCRRALISIIACTFIHYLFRKRYPKQFMKTRTLLLLTLRRIIEMQYDHSMRARPVEPAKHRWSVLRFVEEDLGSQHVLDGISALALDPVNELVWVGINQGMPHAYLAGDLKRIIISRQEM